jgi:hypothetical protein
MIGQATAAAAETERAKAQAQVAISVMTKRFLDKGQRKLEAVQGNVRRAKETLAANRRRVLATNTKQRPPAPTTQQGSGAAASPVERAKTASSQIGQ